MRTPLQGYYAIVDIKGSTLDLQAALHHARRLLVAKPCCLQLRGKALSLADLCTLGHALRPLCREHGVPFCLNDRLDVALAVDADIIHLGQGDLPLGEVLRVRALARPELSIGISAHTVEQARAAVVGGADHIGFGPIFATQSKADADPAVGLAMLSEVSRAVEVPVVAIGGITLDNVDAVAAAGASAAAVIAAVDYAPDPTQAGLRIGRAFGRATPSPPART
jgi:thiamine-phosphate pyrophosphorylase